MVLRLPEPMLARAGTIPHGRGWTFEPKLDGFRCLVCTHAGFRARSRRGWDMTHLLPEFRRASPEAYNSTGSSSRSPTTAGRTSTGSARGCCTAGRHRVDVLRLRRARRRGAGDHDAPVLRAASDPRGARRGEPAGAARGDLRGRRGAVRGRLSRGLEGVVAKRERDPYRPGDREWVKTKNRATARFAEEQRRAGRSASHPLLRPVARDSTARGLNGGDPGAPVRRTEQRARSSEAGAEPEDEPATGDLPRSRSFLPGVLARRVQRVLGSGERLTRHRRRAGGCGNQPLLFSGGSSQCS